jgi:hypothetical protein
LTGSAFGGLKFILENKSFHAGLPKRHGQSSTRIRGFPSALPEKQHHMIAGLRIMVPAAGMP